MKWIKNLIAKWKQRKQFLTTEFTYNVHQRSAPEDQVSCKILPSGEVSKNTIDIDKLVKEIKEAEGVWKEARKTMKYKGFRGGGFSLWRDYCKEQFSHSGGCCLCSLPWT